jgi:GNAT superfamily N-acetyltransferase
VAALTGPVVRAAEAGDAAVVAELFNAINSLDAGGPLVPMTAETVRRDLLGPDPLAVLRVAELDGAVVGFATAHRLYDSIRAAPCLMLNDLYVAPAARRRGAGRALMAHLAAIARDWDAACLWWGVDQGDDEARAFYAALGAREEEVFTGHLLDRDAMARLAATAA